MSGHKLEESRKWKWARQTKLVDILIQNAQEASGNESSTEEIVKKAIKNLRGTNSIQTFYKAATQLGIAGPKHIAEAFSELDTKYNRAAYKSWSKALPILHNYENFQLK